MTILDENVIESQCQLLRAWRIPFRQIGFDVGRQGLKDKEIISLLHNLSRPTFFTRDFHFYDRNLCHKKYCLVYLAVKKEESAIFIRRFFRHKNFNSIAKRKGLSVRISHLGVWVWRINAEHHDFYAWAD